MTNSTALQPAPDIASFDNLGGWENYVNEHFPALEMRDQSSDAFRAHARSCVLGEYNLTHIGSSACRVERTPRLAGTAHRGFLKVMWQLSGQMKITQDHRSVDIAAGGATLCDTTRPYCIRVSDGARLAVLLIPYETDSRLPRYGQRLSATELSDTSTLQAALGALTGMARSQPEPDTPGTADVMHAVNAMLMSTFARMSEPEIQAIDDQRLERARHYITTHLASSELTPERLAGALCMSRRSLYALLARHQLTPARLIGEIRLQHARQALGNAPASETITDIALAHGFSDSARFSRSFKDRFGMPPSAWREGQH